HQRVVIARGLVAFLARTLTNASYPEIGRAMGRRNHSTAHTADQRVQRQMDDGLRVDCGGRGEVSLREVADQLRHEILRTTARGA
ncbi:MAG: hypothetical protein KDA25_02620, partial [Phycisphaerales bacterium]|nr:hypothetical protein [Phycisphaerales bacterium]